MNIKRIEPIAIASIEMQKTIAVSAAFSV